MALEVARSRRTTLVTAAFVSLLAIGLAASYTPDLPRAVLVAKYGGGASRFVRLPSGARAHYRDQGSRDKPALVLVHGSNASLHTWEPWIARLGREHRVVTMDLPGHGLTGAVPSQDYSPDAMVTFLHELVSTLGLARFALGGNSMGGHVSWRYALAHPAQADKLVLLDASGVNHLLPVREQPTPPIGFRLARTPGINQIARVITPRSIVEKTLRASFHDQRNVTSEMIDRYYELLLHPGNRLATGQRAAAHVDPTRADRLPEIRARTLILWGERDALIPVAASRIFERRIPGARRIVYPNVGHIPMEEIPERSARDVHAFLVEP